MGTDEGAALLRRDGAGPRPFTLRGVPEEHSPAPVALSDQDCLRLLGTVRVGRVAVSMDALPVVLPVMFGMCDQGIVVRTVIGTRLDAAMAGSVVAFHADDYRAPGGNGGVPTGWSVLVQGRAFELVDAPVLEQARALGLPSWAPPNASDRYLCIEPALLSGRWYGTRTRP